jgi:drug/metabolite transporter (DMT)-like permease
MSTQHATRVRLAPWALLLVAASWGWAFVIMKDSIARQSVNNFLFSRFALAVVVMVVLRPQVFKLFKNDLVTRSAFAGTFLGAGYILQTLGLERTGAAITGFITGLYVVFTPLIAALILKTRITLITWGCVALATIGLALLSVRGWSVGFGELLVLGSAICFGAHIISLGKWSRGRDAYAMTVIQLAMCTVITGLGSVAEGGYSPPPDWGVWATVVFTAVVCTAVAFMVQTWSQAYMSTTKVAVILTMEVVFAAIFAILFGGEILTLQTAIGGFLVVIAMYVIVIKEA